MSVSDPGPSPGPSPSPEPDTERPSPRYAEIERWDAETLMRALWESQLAAVAAIAPAIPALARAAEAAAARLASGSGRLAYAGAGTSGRIGTQDGAELFPTFDWPRERLLTLIAGGPDALLHAAEGAEDDAAAGAGAAALHRLGPADTLVAVAAGGATPYTLACLRAARAQGALTIGIANAAGAPLLDAAEHPILAETGAEPVAGSTRLKAGTAQKAMLNMLSTAIMTRLHRVHRGRMVAMRASNAKLRRRALRMVSALAGCDPAAARRALDASGGQVRPALLVAAGCDPERAGALLRRHHGDLHAALSEQARHARNDDGT